ncbi:MAG: pseudouridine synthase [Clostridiaceae bacterium]|nr:pseudouridine synthase [Clostridiaceae bacterium]
MTDNPYPESFEKGIRVNKFIASSGYCSRRKADELVAQGIVTIDHLTAGPGDRVMPGQVVRISGEPILPEEDLVYIALHKPVGVTCTTDTSDPDNIIVYLGFDKRIFPIGRLDKMSTGLILLTNDGAIVNKLLRAEYHHEKEYKVEVDRTIDDHFLKSMASGVPILDTVTAPCEIKQDGLRIFTIILTQGLNRQIRRMCEYHGYRVVRLKRTRIMNITLGNLPLGEWRYLKPKELRDLKHLLGL